MVVSGKLGVCELLYKESHIRTDTPRHIVTVMPHVHFVTLNSYLATLQSLKFPYPWQFLYFVDASFQC
jgi:hypothetical protein